MLLRPFWNKLPFLNSQRDSPSKCLSWLQKLQITLNINHYLTVFWSDHQFILFLLRLQHLLKCTFFLQEKKLRLLAMTQIEFHILIFVGIYSWLVHLRYYNHSWEHLQFLLLISSFREIQLFHILCSCSNLRTSKK